MCWLSQTSGYSYLRVTAIRIDVHPAGKNPINTSHAFHVRFAYGPEPYISRGLRRQPFASSPQGWNMPLHPEEVLAINDRLARPSPWVISLFLPHDSLGAPERGFDQVVTQLHHLTGPITPACDQYVQYLLTGANPSVLNRYRRGLQPWRCRLSTNYSPTFPTDGLYFPPKGPARSPI
jgi:hypothetical protein